MKNPKVLLVTLDFWPKVGGVANYYLNLCRQLDSQVSVLTTHNYLNGGTAEQEAEFGFRVFRRKLLVSWLWPHWLLMGRHIWRITRQEKVEILWAGEILPTGTVVYFLSKVLKLPYIVSCHGKDVLQAAKKRRRKKIAQKILKHAKLVTANSYYTKRLVEAIGAESNKIKVVYPGIDARLKIQDSRVKDELVKKYNLEGKKIILSVGRLVARKGFDKVIEAMPRVAVEVPEAVYLIAGEGPDEQKLKALAKQNKKVLFLGRINEQEKRALLKLCDVFIMPARRLKDDVEGFGIVYLEAGLAGKPVIAGNVGGAQEAVIDEQTGLLVNPESADEIVQAVIKLLNNQELAEELGEAGRRRAVEEFSWEKIGREFKAAIG